MTDDDEDPTEGWARIWQPGDDERDEARREGEVRKRREKEVGRFYSITPPQATISRPIENFDPKTFMDRGAPKLSDEVRPERIMFARAMLYGNAEGTEWIEEILTPKMARIKNELEVFVGQAMGEPDGPWRLFLIRRTTCGSMVEEE